MAEPGPAQHPLHGLYAGVDAKLTSLAGTAGVFVGPHVGWVVADVFVFGLGAYTLAHGLHPTSIEGTGTLRVTYGDLRAGYVFLPEAPIHPTLLLLVGAGSASVAERGDLPEVGAAMFLLEPALELELAPSAWRPLRAGAAASYRIAMLPEIAGVDRADLSGLTGSAFVRIGF
jgi:hypothetical protein